jgi:hypothetical protein
MGWGFYTPSGTILEGTGDAAASSGGTVSPLTTKGDLYTYSTENARLPVGTSKQKLIPDSSEVTGLKWVDDPYLIDSGSSTVTVVSTTTETSLIGGGFTIPANLLGTGNWVEVRIPIKILLTAGGGSVVFNLTLGGTSLFTATSAAFAGSVTGYGDIVVKIKGNGATNQQLAILYFDGSLNGNVNSAGVANTGTGAKDSTTNLVLDVTADPQINSAACGAVGYGFKAVHIPVG